MEFEILKTTKNQESILFKSYRYFLKTENKDNTKYWKCGKPGCTASITTAEEWVVKINGRRRENMDDIDDTHTSRHILEPIEIEAITSINDMKQKVKASSQTVESIYREEQLRLATKFNNLDIVAEHVKPFYSIKSRLYRSRNEAFPPIPHSLEELIIEGTPYSRM